PSVVGTMQKSGMSAPLRCDGGSVMATNIVKGPQNAIVAAHHYDRFTSDGGSDEMSRRVHLISSRDQLPGLAEYTEALEFRDTGIGILSCGNRRGLREWGTIIVAR